MKPELILFDLDDTLMAFDLVTVEAWDKTVDIFIQKNDIKLDKPLILERIHATRKWYWSDPERHKTGRANIVNARRDIVKLALKEYSNLEISKLEELADTFSNIHEDLWYLLDGVEETLQKLKEKKYKIGNYDKRNFRNSA